MPNLGNTNTLMDIPHKTIVQSKYANLIICVLLLVLQECSSIEVSGGFTWTRGTYVLSDEKISNDSSRPLWKQTNKTLNKTNYIFNDGSSNGWQIGYKKGLRYIAFYLSEYILFLHNYICKSLINFVYLLK